MELKAIDFFCGAGGMTNGFIQAGIKVLGGIDIDKECEQTYTFNNPGAKFLHFDIKCMPYEVLGQEFGIKKRDNELIFIGCSPCQYWSKIKTDRSKAQESKNLIEDFGRFIAYYKPGYVVVENVPGILNRIDESPLTGFLNFLDENGYRYKYQIINASHYGIPQTRKRFLLVASRVLMDIALPEQCSRKQVPTVREFIGEKSIFSPIPSGHRDTSDFIHTAAKLSENNIKRLENTPINGGSRMVYFSKKSLAIKSHYKKGDFSDSYSRMFWDKPAPTITTRFNSISNGRFAHPEQDRAISLREGATLQTFDLKYKFLGRSQSVIAKQIGNAVPPLLGRKIAESILNNGKQKKQNRRTSK